MMLRVDITRSFFNAPLMGISPKKRVLKNAALIIKAAFLSEI